MLGSDRNNGVTRALHWQRMFKEALRLYFCLAAGDERLRFHSLLLVVRVGGRRHTRRALRMTLGLAAP
jgi:hypothetical protein